MDFNKKLTEHREKKKQSLDDRLANLKPKAPSMNPGGKVKIVEELPPPPTIIELDVPITVKNALSYLVRGHLELSKEIKEATTSKKDVADRLKEILSEFPILHEAFTVGGARVKYYSVNRGSLDKHKLMSHGVSQKIIDACTNYSESWQVKVTAPGAKDEDE